MKYSRSKIEESFRWRVWNIVNNIIGGTCFLIGSLVLLPAFEFMPTATLSAWLYIIGCLSYFFSDFTNFLLYFDKDGQKDCSVATYLLNTTVSVLYLSGSICLIPEMSAGQYGLKIFILGSFILMIKSTTELFKNIFAKRLGRAPIYMTIQIII